MAMKYVFRIFLLSFALFFISNAQKLHFAETFNRDGTLKNHDSVFTFKYPHIIRAVKLVATQTLPSETLYVIVKDYEKVVGRFYMKRSKRKPNEGNALIRLKEIGIFRVLVYDPKNRTKPLAKGYVFVTNQDYPTPEALILRQLKILVEKGKLHPSILKQIEEKLKEKSKAKSKPVADNNTGNTNTTANNTSSNNTTSAEDIGEDFSADISDIEEDLDTDIEVEDIEVGDLEDLDLGLDELFGEDEDMQSLEQSGDDFSGEFESFDTLDDEFDFEISDF